MATFTEIFGVNSVGPIEGGVRLFEPTHTSTTIDTLRPAIEALKTQQSIDITRQYMEGGKELDSVLGGIQRSIISSRLLQPTEVQSFNVVRKLLEENRGKGTSIELLGKPYYDLTKRLNKEGSQVREEDELDYEEGRKLDVNKDPNIGRRAKLGKVLFTLVTKLPLVGRKIAKHSITTGGYYRPARMQIIPPDYVGVPERTIRKETTIGRIRKSLFYLTIAGSVIFLIAKDSSLAYKDAEFWNFIRPTAESWQLNETKARDIAIKIDQQRPSFDILSILLRGPGPILEEQVDYYLKQLGLRPNIAKTENGVSSQKDQASYMSDYLKVELGLKYSDQENTIAQRIQLGILKYFNENKPKTEIKYDESGNKVEVVVEQPSENNQYGFYFKNFIFKDSNDSVKNVKNKISNNQELNSDEITGVLKSLFKETYLYDASQPQTNRDEVINFYTKVLRVILNNFSNEFKRTILRNTGAFNGTTTSDTITDYSTIIDNTFNELRKLNDEELRTFLTN